jgi:hypothetical protein
MFTSTATPFDQESYAKFGAAGVLVSHVASTLEAVGQRIHTAHFEELVRDRWGDDYEDLAEFHRAEARQHELSAAHMRELAKELEEDAESYESLAKKEWARARDCEREQS